MVQVRVQDSLSSAEHAQVLSFLDTVAETEQQVLNDHLRSDLMGSPRAGFTAAFATDGHGALVGYAQASAANDGWLLGCVRHGAPDAITERLLHDLLDALPAGATATWWLHDGIADELAARIGLRPDRRLLNMRRTFPLEVTTDVVTRPFVVGIDEPAWLAVNNAAFAWHGEQGGWDLATLQQREREPWFDPDGFLLHERDGRLAAFCWTKLHTGAADGPVGEIYVIAVDPRFHGLGLGRAMTVAGLRHLQSVGAHTAMLYVDGENTAAIGLYRNLGFAVAHTDQSYHRGAGHAAANTADTANTAKIEESPHDVD